MPVVLCLSQKSRSLSVGRGLIGTKQPCSVRCCCCCCCLHHAAGCHHSYSKTQDKCTSTLHVRSFVFKHNASGGAICSRTVIRSSGHWTRSVVHGSRFSIVFIFLSRTSELWQRMSHLILKVGGFASFVYCAENRSNWQKFIKNESENWQIRTTKICARIDKSIFLSASLYVSKRGVYWDRLCRDVVGRWLVVTRVYCGQTVHPRPIVTMEH